MKNAHYSDLKKKMYGAEFLRKWKIHIFIHSLAAFVLPWEVRAERKQLVKKNLAASFVTRTEAFQGGG